MYNRCIRVYEFYRNGFREMTWGRSLWVIILIKLFIMFAILKVFFFPSFLSGKTDGEKSDYVGDQLVERASGQDATSVSPDESVDMQTFNF